MNLLELHAFNLGKIVVNLQSLEIMLRLFLCEAKGEDISIPAPGAKDAPETHLTNYFTLGDLIQSYNNLLSTLETPAFALDFKVVRLRDAIAHGRTLDQAPPDVIGPVRLFKFHPPRKGKARLSFDELLSDEWFRENTVLVLTQMRKVSECAQQRRYRSIGHIASSL
jgi:hypothetical protein